jgi:DNA-binding beta-propeller fold protein YncE
VTDTFDEDGAAASSEDLAERRRNAQRARMKAARRARLGAVVPWVVVGALSVAATVCFMLAFHGASASGPPPADPSGAAGASSNGKLAVTRVLSAADATLGAPAGVAAEGDRVYVAYPRSGVVEALTREGSRTATIGEGWLTTPAYVAVGPVDGRIYVSDRTRGEVGVFAFTGEIVGVLAPDGLRMEATSGPTWRPLALTFAPDGTLLVADSSDRQSIAVFSPAGSRIGTLGADVPPGRTGKVFAFVNGIAATASRIVVADSNNGRLLDFDHAGAFVGAIAAEGLPRGVVVTAGGRIVITDAASEVVSLRDSAGKPLQTLDGGVGMQERFASPAGIARGAGDVVYVSDASTGQIFVLTTGEGEAGSEALPVGTRWVLLVLGVAACAGALLLAKVTENRARARVRA